MIRRILIAALAVAGLLFTAAEQAKAENIFVINTSNTLYQFDSATPNAASLVGNISGLQSGEVIVGIDIRPTTGQLFALSSQSRIYTLNQATGSATFVANLSTPLSGGVFGFDFNPAVDTAGGSSMRITSSTNQNFAVNANDGTVTVQTQLAYAMGDPNFGQNPNIGGSAYLNNFAGTTATTLFGIDTNLGILVTQNPAPSGQLQTVGSLGVTTSGVIGFDISGLTGTAYAALNPNQGFSNLYTLNLATGAASLVGPILFNGQGFLVGGLAAPIGAPIPEPATMVLFGTGLAGTASAIRRRRKANKRDAEL